MNRDFDAWLSTFRDSIADYCYYVDFGKVYANVEKLKVELNILNSLIGSKNIEAEFINIVKKYPEVLKCIPILLAVRQAEIKITDVDKTWVYDFKSMTCTPSEYAIFMEKTGLFNLLSNHVINNLFDYVTGVETGLDSNGRKNRGGHLMENLVEAYLKKAGLKRDVDYFKEMYASTVQESWDINLDPILNDGQADKRFDFVVKTKNCVYGIETNFYTGGGSKLNETARSYKTITLEAKTISKFQFVWFTDGIGWISARHNLKETFDVLENLYNITDMENGVMKKIFK